jgi:SecD/SecF fusion protein
MNDRQRNWFILAIVAALVVVSLIIIATQPTILGLDLKGGVELVYQGEPTAQGKVTSANLDQAVTIMRERVDQLGVSSPQIQTTGNNLITVSLPAISDLKRAQNQVGSTAQLFFYDWEKNVLIPTGPNAGKTVASQVQIGDPTAILISQGTVTSPPGSPGAGAVPLYDAVQLAHKQPPVPPSKNQSHLGPAYYLFGASGSAACKTAAQTRGYTPIIGQHCLLAGPESSLQYIEEDLKTTFGDKVTVSDGQLLTVPVGTVVLQATDANQSKPTPAYSPEAQFFVLNDSYGLRGGDITNPSVGTDPAGNPDVQFNFTGMGQNEFAKVTSQLASRGALNHPVGRNSFYQHFAVALDGKLITVPSINYNEYPDGISGSGGADITGGFTSTTAQDLATLLSDGALPITLRQISSSQVSATLGSQALHEGLIAGLAGLLIIIIFLIAYYRVLGIIATGALFVYGIYFFALLKLIPVTLTLPGIAGLILTIGVAADANIVIFERVKEEVRAGRSVRAGIVEGYKKGLTAIVDANVVTLLTAFILFVLATSDVQGFAFTLGLGTIVSLFTAVMATQAMLMTIGGSKVLGNPAAIGAGRPKRVWRYDFMGASKYFFTMSGCILLIGALAIGGKGLNLGIDFTSGTRITVGLDRPATQKQIQSIMSSVGAGDAQVQGISNKSLGAHAFQISTKPLTRGIGTLETDLNRQFGVRSFDQKTIGPTFGKTVANSAIEAIIASLIVISAYIALRFQWKFSVPVLIALMHDLLITAGIYALSGREVTADTVAALLTILGYSMYDTIIVFDRVRENVPRMPRAAFSQIVNRSMSEVLTRSLATTFCTLMPIVALLLFGGNQTLQDFAFALLIGVVSGAYSSIFIASPVLTHWKEREHLYINKRRRIVRELGSVPAYADSKQDVDPTPKAPRRAGRLTQPEPETVSAAEFEQMKRELELEDTPAPGRTTSTLTRRLAHSPEAEADAPGAPKRRQRPKPAPPAGGKRTDSASSRSSGRADSASSRPGAGKEPAPSRSAPSRSADVAPEPAPARSGARPEPAAPVAPAAPVPPVAPAAPAAPVAPAGDGRTDATVPDPDRPVAPAPDVPENDGVAQVPKPKPAPRKSAPRNRRHGRPR